MSINQKNLPADQAEAIFFVPPVTLLEEFRRSLRYYLKWSWLLAAAAVLGGMLAFLVSQQQARVYAARATVLVHQPQNRVEAALQPAGESLVETYSVMMVQGPVLQGVIDILGLENTTEQLKNNIDIELIEDTRLLRIRIEHHDPGQAAQIANTLGQVFAQQIEASQTATFQEMKDNLNAQLAGTEQQINGTLAALDDLAGASDDLAQRTILETKLDIYSSIYSSLLEQSLTISNAGADSGDQENTRLLARLEALAALIEETESSLASLGVEEGVEYELLQARLKAYQSVYDSLISQVVNAAGGEAEDNGLPLAEQIIAVETLIQEALAERLRVGGGEGAGSQEQDRLSSNLVLYRRTYASLVLSLEQVRLAEIESTARVELVEPAEVPARPIRPSVLQNTILGVMIGVIGAGSGLVLWRALDDTVKTAEDVGFHLQLPVLATIHHMSGRDWLAKIHLRPRSREAEAFHALRTHIRFANGGRPVGSLLVTSPMPGEGKSTITAHLAVIMGQGERQVVVLDGDLRKPTLHKSFQQPNKMGLSELFVQDALDLRGYLQRTRVDNVWVLNSGGLPPNPAELIASERMAEIMHRLKAEADLVMLDTPPVNAVTDAVVLASDVDAVLLVVRVGQTRLEAARLAVEQLRRAGANILGVVLNDADSQTPLEAFFGRLFRGSRRRR